MKGNKLIARIKNIKHIEYILAVVFLVIIIAVYFSSFGKSESEESSNIEVLDGLEYASAMESKLENILSEIKGAGEVSVMISVESGGELVLAYNIEEETVISSSGAETISVVKTPIMISNAGDEEPLVLMTIYPKPTGVIVVADGAGSAAVKLEMISAIQSVLTISNEKIQIFEGKN